jgi:diadenosine tetraphosphate (Ap4A) HIT family hydrolase
MTCSLCHDTSGLVHETDHTRVLLHPDWSPPGHLMVVAKRHVENASDLYADEWTDLTRVWQRVERVLLDVTGAERAVILKLGIQTPHLHFHIYPVRATDTRDDVFAAIDGKRGAPLDEALVANLRQHLTADPC